MRHIKTHGDVIVELYVFLSLRLFLHLYECSCQCHIYIWNCPMLTTLRLACEWEFGVWSHEIFTLYFTYLCIIGCYKMSNKYLEQNTIKLFPFET